MDWTESTAARPTSGGPFPAVADKRLTAASLSRAQQLDLEHECGVGRDDAARTRGAIAQGGRDHESSRLADRHCRHAFVPAFDDAPHAEGELERLVAVARAVELRPVRQPAGAAAARGLSFLCLGAGTR